MTKVQIIFLKAQREGAMFIVELLNQYAATVFKKKMKNVTKVQIMLSKAQREGAT